MKPSMWIAAIALALAAAPALAQPATPPTPVAARTLTIESTLRELVLDPRTRPVIERHMPGFPDRLENDQGVQEMFADVSLFGMSKDPHVRGFTQEALDKIGAELAEAQKTPAPAPPSSGA